MENSSFEIERGSDRNFGLVIASVFALIGGYHSWQSGELLWWPFAVAIVLVTVAIVYPRLLQKPNYWWFRTGLFLGGIVAPLVMALVYISTVVPLGLIIRLMGKDILRLKKDEMASSYWIERESPPQPMKNQF